MLYSCEYIMNDAYPSSSLHLKFKQTIAENMAVCYFDSRWLSPIWQKASGRRRSFLMSISGSSIAIWPAVNGASMPREANKPRMKRHHYFIIRYFELNKLKYFTILPKDALTEWLMTFAGFQHEAFYIVSPRFPAWRHKGISMRSTDSDASDVSLPRRARMR